MVAVVPPLSIGTKVRVPVSLLVVTRRFGRAQKIGWEYWLSIEPPCSLVPAHGLVLRKRAEELWQRVSRLNVPPRPGDERPYVVGCIRRERFLKDRDKSQPLLLCAPRSKGSIEALTLLLLAFVHLSSRRCSSSTRRRRTTGRNTSITVPAIQSILSLSCSSSVRRSLSSICSSYEMLALRSFEPASCGRSGKRERGTDTTSGTDRKHSPSISSMK